jgi:exonuclease SbcC
MPGAWRLKKLVVAGFRGYNGSQTIDLTAPFTLLEGPQRAGKSSTLAAVEWALFGNEIAKKAIGIDERKDWEVRNRNADEAVVELVLSNNQEELRITRSDQKRKGGASFQWELNGKPSIDEGQLRSLLGISPKDYFSSVHLHQEVIRALLIDEPRSRRDMLDRLLGLSDLRNILDGTKQAKLAEALKAADQKFNGIEAQLNAIVANKRRDIQNHKNAALAKAVAAACFTENGAEQLCRDVKSLLEQFAQQCGVTLGPLPSVTTLQAQREFSASARRALRMLRNEQPDLKRQQALLDKQSDLQKLKSVYVSDAKELQRLESARAQIEREDGTREKIQARIDSELQPKLGTAKRRRIEIDKRAGVIEEAIQYFEATKESTTKSACPVCEKEVVDIAHLRAHLNELRDAAKNDLAPVQNEIEKLEAEILRLRNRVRELDALLGQITPQQGKVAQSKQSAQAALGRTIAGGEDPNPVLNWELARISGELEGIKDRVAKSNEKLNEIEDAIQAVDEVLKVVGLEAEIDQLLKIKDSDEYKAVESAKNDLEQLAADVELIQSTVADALQSAAKEKLEAAKTAIADNFKKLANRPDFHAIEIDPESYDILAVRGAEKVSALSIFNQGDLNCAAASVFLGLGAAPEVSHQLGFLILDDPSQSMDKTHKDNLVALFNSLPEDKQTIVSTSESEFAQTILGSVMRKKKHYRFEPWSDDKGAQPKEAQV